MLLGFLAGFSGRAAAPLRPPPEAPRSEPPGRITFNAHVARVLHQRCAPCHHQGQAAPFNLVTYADVARRAAQILQAVEQRLMPPWLAEPGYGVFANERRLTDDERALLRQWVADGALEGDPGMAPPIPTWPSGWAAGTPDLVVTMERPFRLGPEGPDVYRNFLLRLPLERDRFVRAVEFAPGNPRAVHHAFIRVDEGGQGRRLEGRQSEPGFPNMVPTARMPGGQFLTWNPGARPIVSPPGLAWRLPKTSDLVVEMHLNRSGKPESIQSSVGIYFTEEQPTNACQVFKLGSFALDFPAGATDVVVRDSMVLPVDVDLLAVYPHAHFLCREMQGYAVRPDGTKEWLIWIRRWDFNWQGDYRYQKPVHLPKGTTVHLQFSYDNSTNNPVNPHHPPRRVRYGPESTDEMCELGFQALTHRPGDGPILAEAGALHRGTLIQDMFRHRLQSDPKDAEALTRLGMILWMQERNQEAWDHLQRAVQARPDFAEAHHNKGVFLRINGQPGEARREFETALQLDPHFPETHQQLAFALAALGRLADAERHFETALHLDPTDATARAGLDELRQAIRARRSNQ